MVKELNVQGIYPVKTYFYIDEKTNSGFMIDPGAQADVIFDYIKKNGWNIEKILLTHGHMDHIGAVNELREKLQIPVFIHKDEENFLSNGILNLSDNFGSTMVVDNYSLFHNDKVSLKSNPDFYLEIIHTPGHTPGSVIFYNPENRIAFIGDNLFEHGMGLTHFPGGDIRKLEDSINNILLKLPADTILYSGHAAPISIAEQEKLLNEQTLI